MVFLLCFHQKYIRIPYNDRLLQVHDLLHVDYLLSFLTLQFFFFKQKTAYEMLRSLVGSEMCIRDSPLAAHRQTARRAYHARQLRAAGTAGFVAGPPLHRARLVEPGMDSPLQSVADVGAAADPQVHDAIPEITRPAVCHDRKPSGSRNDGLNGWRNSRCNGRQNGGRNGRPCKNKNHNSL